MPQVISSFEASMQLTSAGNGKWVRITGFAGGKELEQKFRQMGILPGDLIRVIRRAPFRGPLLIESKGREIAISMDLATLILVSKENGCVSL